VVLPVLRDGEPMGVNSERPLVTLAFRKRSRI
jgi:hypothetical protein